MPVKTFIDSLAARPTEQLNSYLTQLQPPVYEKGALEQSLMAIPTEQLTAALTQLQQAPTQPFSGARQPERSTMSIASPYDKRDAEIARQTLPQMVKDLAMFGANFAPGSGEYLSAQQSVESTAKARKAIDEGNYLEASAQGLDAVVNAVGSIPIAHQIMALGKGAVGVAKGLMGAEHIIPAITTYHGSPTSGIRKWDLNFRGTGEGRLPVDSPARESFTDMIGHGLYSAEKEGIAKGYQDRLTDYEFNRNILRQMYDDLAEQQKQTKEWKAKLRGADASDADKRFLQHHLNREQSLREQIAEQEKRTKPGALYTTELTPHPDEFLLWDKPLSEQSEKVKEIWNNITPESLGLTIQQTPAGKYELVDSKGMARSAEYEDIDELKDWWHIRPSGQKFYENLISNNLGSDKAASEYLNSLGIRGVKYLDNPSRGAGEGTYNYVTFNPAEEAIITHENGQRIPGAVEEAYRKLRDPKSKAIMLERYPELKDLDKPLVNSQGNEIKNPENFKNWFGESKVVDAEGKPLVVYHGSTRGGITNSDSRRSFFTSSQDVAETYSKDDYAGAKGESPVVQPAYLKMVNPLVTDANGGMWMDIEYKGKNYTTDELAAIAKKNGNDGVLVKNLVDNVGDEEIPPSDIYITLGNKAQIKSINNRGTFDPNNPNILMGAAPLAAAGLLGGKDDTVRNDGTKKGNGYFGPLPMQDGSNKIATEIAVGVNINGKEVEIPTLVPILTASEIDYLLKGKKPTPAIMHKAVEHARMRMKRGLSPFASSGDLQ